MKKTRVEVKSGDMTQDLGYGYYVGDVTVYCILMPDGSIQSLKNAEERPTKEMVAKTGGRLETMKNNPKIIMDDGSVVYGCQVWWNECLTAQN